jgi:TonB-linked SusC/RagA family outer membrane protein
MTTLLKQGNRLRFLIASLFVLMGFASQAQVILKGKVTGPNGAAISNASVQVEPSNAGTNTDASGNYSITTTLKPGKYTLVFSSVGYKRVTKAITVSGNDAFDNDVALAADQLGLDEVVVIGSSLSQSRKQLGNTVNSVSSKQLQNTGSGNLSAALQGKVPGAQITQTSGDPAGGISIRMRGTSSILGSAEPLYVIDGVIISNQSTNVTNLNVNPGAGAQTGNNRLVDINPNDIEKIDVIPGASASAIYGSRASNGVVLITTKKGKTGQMKIDFSTSIQSNSLRKRVYITKYGKMFGNTRIANGDSYALGNISNKPNNYSATGGQTVYTRPSDNAVRTFATDLVDVQRYDYQDDLFQRGLGTDNHISLSGGNEKGKYYFSGGYYKNEGIIVGTDFRRVNFKTRVDQTVSKYLSISAGVAYSNSFSNEKPNGNVFGSPINSMNINNNVFNLNDKDANGDYKAVDQNRVNPLSTIYGTDYTQDVNRTIADVQLKLKPTKGLTIDYIFGIDNIAQQGKSLIKRYPYQYNIGPLLTPVVAGFEGLGYASIANANSFFVNNDLNVSYTQNFNKISSLTVAGFNQQSQKINSVAVEARDLAAGVTSIDGAAAVAAPRSGVDRRVIFGGFLQQTFGYDNLFFVTLAGRYDGSTIFSKDKTKYFYPKVSTSISLSDFGFWKKNKIDKVVNAARLRMSWGKAGNLSGIDSYDAYNNYAAGNFNGVTTYNIPSTSGNPIIKTERHQEFEYGADVSFFNKLSVTFTAYNKTILDNSLLIRRIVAPSSGANQKVENVGNITNKGWELGLNFTPVAKENFSWNVFASFNKNKNTVVSSKQLTPITFGAASGAPTVILPNESVGVFYGAYFDRDAAGNMLLDAAGRPLTKVNPANGQLALKVIGDPNPDMVLSFGNTISYKKITFNFLFDGALGQDVFNADRRTRQGVGIGELAEQELKGEVPRGYTFAIYNAEEWRIESGSFIKLRELSLSYGLPSFAKFVKNSSITLTGRNLISFDTYKGYDPETNAGGNASVLRGIDFGNIPNPKTVQFTFRAQF